MRTQLSFDWSAFDSCRMLDFAFLHIFSCPAGFLLLSLGVLLRFGLRPAFHFRWSFRSGLGFLLANRAVFQTFFLLFQCLILSLIFLLSSPFKCRIFSVRLLITLIPFLFKSLFSVALGSKRISG